MSRIVCNPNILGGIPIIEGTRLPVTAVLHSLIEDCDSIDEVASLWEIGRSDVLEVLTFCYDIIKHIRFVNEG